MRLLLSFIAAAAFLAVMVVIATPGHAKDDNKEAARDLAEYKKLWNSKSYIDKLKAVQKLPEGYEGAVKDILDTLNSEEWMFRGAAMVRLFQEKDEGVLKQYETLLFEKEKRAPVLEHMIWALYRNPAFATPERWKRLGELIGNAKKVDVKVRSRAVREMGVFTTPKQARENFEVLLAHLETYSTERKPDRLMVFLLGDALESLTNQEYGDEVKSWKNWLENNKDRDFTPRQGEKLTKDLQEIQLQEHSYARKRGREIENLDVLFLPEFGYSGLYWMPYIFELNKIFACYMVSLPDASKVKPEPKRPIPDGYVYPLPQLVEAFEKRRELSKQKKVGIVAHGVSGWIALQYARQRPDSIAFIIVISTWSGQGSFRNQVTTLYNNNNPIIKYYGQSLQYDGSGRSGAQALTEEQRIFARIGAYKRMYMDPYAIEPFLYNEIEAYKELPGGGVALVPDFEFKAGAGGKPIDVPAMVMWGAKDWCHSRDDQKAIPMHFKNPTLAMYENSYRMLWAEEPVRFFDDVRKMIQKYGIGKEDNKKEK